MIKKILKYKTFVKENINNNDINSELNKKKYDELKKQIEEYKSKKNNIDNIFKKYGNEKERLKIEIEKLLNKGSNKNNNSFLIDYVQISKIENDIKNIENDNIKDKMSIENLNKEKSSTTDNNIKKNIDDKIKEIKKNILNRNKDLINLKKELNDFKKKFNEKIKKTQKEIKDSTKIIYDNNKK